MVNALAEKMHLPRGCPKQAREDMDGCRLARSVGSNYGDNLSLMHAQRNPFQYVNIPIMGLEIIDA